MKILAYIVMAVALCGCATTTMDKIAEGNGIVNMEWTCLGISVGVVEQKAVIGYENAKLTVVKTVPEITPTLKTNFETDVSTGVVLEQQTEINTNETDEE